MHAVVCGDFNSLPGTPVYEHLTLKTGFVSVYSSLQRLAATQKILPKEATWGGGVVAAEPELQSQGAPDSRGVVAGGEVNIAGSSQGGGDVVPPRAAALFEPAFSNVRDTFSGTLDYIFVRGLPARCAAGQGRRARSKPRCFLS